STALNTEQQNIQLAKQQQLAVVQPQVDVLWPTLRHQQAFPQAGGTLTSYQVNQLASREQQTIQNLLLPPRSALDIASLQAKTAEFKQTANVVIDNAVNVYNQSTHI